MGRGLWKGEKLNWEGNISPIEWYVFENNLSVYGIVGQLEGIAYFKQSGNNFIEADIDEYIPRLFKRVLLIEGKPDDPEVINALSGKPNPDSSNTSGIMKESKYLENVEIEPGQFLACEIINVYIDSDVYHKIPARTRRKELRPETTEVFIPWKGKKVHWKSEDDLISIRVHDGILYMIGWYRSNESKIHFYKQNDTQFEPIDPSEYPKAIAIQNRWFDGDKNLINATLELNPDNYDFCRSLTVSIWGVLMTGKQYNEVSRLSDEERKQIAIEYIKRYKPLKLTKDIGSNDSKDGNLSDGFTDENSKITEDKKTIMNSIDMKMVYIPAGKFLMGSRVDFYEMPVHKVRISKGFYLGMYEVTQAQYQRIMGTNPSNFKGENNPVETVSWDDAVEYCKKLSEKEGGIYRLPTEAEWEYACRAGSTSDYCFGDSVGQLSDYAWYEGNSGKATHPVGQKQPNAWGLYDMHGNVCEWCLDWRRIGYESGDVSDPSGPRAGEYRVSRGGSWNSYGTTCRSANRRGAHPYRRFSHYGFRVVMEDLPGSSNTEKRQGVTAR